VIAGVPVLLGLGTVGAMVLVGGVVSITIGNSGDDPLVFPLGSVNLTVMLWIPSAIALVGVILYVPLTGQTWVGVTAIPSTYSVTVSPGVQVPVKVGLLLLVLSSVLLIPVSVAAVMSGADDGATGAVVSTTSSLVVASTLLFPALSVLVVTTS
jgi:hypothetical protein